MTKKILILWLTVTTVSGLCFGQKDYRTGYIITNDFDTIHGLINLRSNYHNSRSCEFKNEINSETKTFLPNDIRGYRIEDSKFYVSREININNEKQFVFLEYLLDGIVDLFYLKELRSDDFFIEKQGVLYQLSNENKRVVVNNKIYEKNSNQYIGVLNDLFRDSPETLNKIENTPFSYKPLISITKDYHNHVCKDQECIDYTKSTKKEIWFEPNLGTSFSWITYKTSKYYAHDLSPSGGLIIRFVPFRSYYLWNFKTGVILSKTNYSGDFKNEAFHETYHIIGKYLTINIPLSVEYSFPARKIQPFISFSYNNIFLVNPDFRIYNIYPYQYRPYLSAYSKYQIGLSTEFGLKYNLNKFTYLYIKNGFEYTRSSQNFNRIFDFYRIYSYLINIGIGFSTH
jgi:hypothetical protein